MKIEFEEEGCKNRLRKICKGRRSYERDVFFDRILISDLYFKKNKLIIVIRHITTTKIYIRNKMSVITDQYDFQFYLNLLQTVGTIFVGHFMSLFP